MPSTPRWPPQGILWQNVLEVTGQPPSMVNDA
jgi:hypothetical protein